MKYKFLSKISLVTLIFFFLVTGLQQCKNVGPIDMPAPDFDATHQIIIKAYENEGGTALMEYNVCVNYPDGAVEKFYNKNNPFKINDPEFGIFTINVSKEGYIQEEMSIAVDDYTIGTNTEVLIIQDFYLNKYGDTTQISATGTTLSLKSSHQQNSTLEFPAGSVPNDKILSITFLQPTLKHGCLQIIENRVISEGYLVTPHINFPESSQPVLKIPINNTNIIEGAPFFYGVYDSINHEWEMIEGELNETRTIVSFKISHFSKGYLFGQLSLIFKYDEWSDRTKFATGACDEGVSGTYTYVSPPNPLIQILNTCGYNYVQKVSSGRRFRGPKKGFKQELWGRCLRRIFAVYDHRGIYLGNIEVPWIKMEITVETIKCHDQGGG